MTQDLQSLLEKIQRDGIAKAQAESARLLDDARAQAKALINEAHAEAARMTSTARQEAEAFERRAEETMRQAGRDVLLQVEGAVTALFTRLLVQDVKAVLDDTALVSGLAAEAVRAYLGGNESVEVVAAAPLADALRGRLAADLTSGGVDVLLDEAVGSGFRVRLANGRIEHDFTGVALAEFLAKRLRPRLAALMRQKENRQ